MKFTGTSNGLVGGIIKFLLCVILGIVIAIGGEVLGVYLLITKEGSVGKLEQVAQDKGVSIDVDDATAKKSLLAWGKEVYAALANAKSSKIGDIENLVGVSAISNAISSFSGVSGETIKTSTIGDLGKTVSDNMTINTAKEKLGIDLPDMPLFNDATFTSAPLSTAFADIDGYSINKFITIDASSNAVLRELSTTPIKDMGGAAVNSKIMSMCVCEIMDIDETTASEVVKSIMYCSLESQYEKDADTGEFILQDGKKVYKKKTLTLSNPDGSTYTKEVELIGIQEKMDTIAVKDVLTINETSSVFLRKMRKPTAEEIADGKGSLFGEEDILINQMSAKMSGIINSVVLCEMMTIDDTSSKALQALKYACIESQYETDANGQPIIQDGKKVYKTTTILENGVPKTVPLIGIGEKMKEVTVGEVIAIDENSSAVLRKLRKPTSAEIDAGKESLFGTEDVKLDELGSKMQGIIEDTTIGEILGAPAEGETREPILVALNDAKIGELNTKIAALTLYQIFGEKANSGAISLIDSSTVIGDVPTAMTAAITNANVATLQGKGVINVSSDMSNMAKDQKAFINNSGMNDMINGLISFINKPLTDDVVPAINYALITPAKVELNTDFESLDAFVNAYKQYNTLELKQNVTVTVTAADSKYLQNGIYCIPVANIKGAFALNFVDVNAQTVVPSMAVYNQDASGNVAINNGAAVLSRNQYAYVFVTDATVNINLYAATITRE